MIGDLITTRQLAERWGMSVGTLKNWRWQGTGPAWEKYGQAVLYRRSVVERYELTHPPQPRHKNPR